MPETDSPPLSPLARALGRVPSGLFVVSAPGKAGPLGFVGSFVQQVGFSPPSLCVAIAHERDHLRAIRETGRFAVSVLGSEGRGLMSPFFRPVGEGESPFDRVEHAPTPGGLPYLRGALAWLECRRSGEHEAGDHVVVFGEVVAGELLREGEPAVHTRRNGLSY